MTPEMSVLDKLNIKHEEREPGDHIKQETVIQVPVVGIEFVLVERRNGNTKAYARREGDTLPRYMIHPETKKMDYSEEERAEYE